MLACPDDQGGHFPQGLLASCLDRPSPGAIMLAWESIIAHEAERSPAGIRIPPMLRRGVLVLAMITLTSCGDEFPEHVVRNFVNSCVAQPGASEAYCECTIDRIQETMTLEEFIQADRAIREGADLPAAVAAAVEECREAS